MRGRGKGLLVLLLCYFLPLFWQAHSLNSLDGKQLQLFQEFAGIYIRYVSMLPLATLSMKKGQTAWSNGRGPYIGLFFLTLRAKLARVTPESAG